VPIQVVSADFNKTATKPAEWPRGPVPELAFVGRSNVGKSSMLNALARRKGLARVSATPGRTRALQFFDVSYRPSPAARPRAVRFCDLPGYGYAKVSRAERDSWAAMIEDYLRERDVLRAVVLIVDARHPPSESDEDAAAFLRAAGRRVVVAATKMDKLPKTRRAAALKVVEQALDAARGDVVPFSAVEGTGTDQLWARLAGLAAEGAPATPGPAPEAS
jgi:GTP-binding protein